MDKSFAELSRIVAVSNSHRTIKVWRDVIHELYSEEDGIIETADIMANMALERSSANDIIFDNRLGELLNKYITDPNGRAGFKNEFYSILVKLGS